MKTLYHIIAFIFISSLETRAQDIHFSQFFEAPLIRNPSLAGIFTGDVRVQAVYRDQWNSLTNAFKTTALNAEYKMPIGKGNDYITPGIQILNDRAGTVSWVTTHLLAAINYHKSLSVDRNRYLSLGFMGGPVQSHFDRSKMTTNSTYDGLGDGENFLMADFHYIDASVGMSYNSQLNDNVDNNFYLGMAYHHFNHPHNSFYRNAYAQVEPKWVASAGLRFSVTPWSYLTFLGDQSFQGKYQETLAGALYGLKLGDDPLRPDYTIHGGLFLRWNDALIPVFKVDYSSFSFSLSYDINLSPLKSSSYGRGGFELGLSYIGFTKNNNSSLKAVNCPRF
ncbi:MAG: hypothetical protein NVS1B13_15560 [Flavisolibacter sp.]